jgi:hypothetical protein
VSHFDVGNSWNVLLGYVCDAVNLEVYFTLILQPDVYEIGYVQEFSGFVFKLWTYFRSDRHCGLMVRVSGYRSRGVGFYSRHYQIL